MGADLESVYTVEEFPGKARSLYKSYAGEIYGGENEIWAGFGTVGNPKKKWGPIMSNF